MQDFCNDLEEEDVKRLDKAFRTEMLFFEADSLSEKIIEYYQRYLKRKGYGDDGRYE